MRLQLISVITPLLVHLSTAHPLDHSSPAKITPVPEAIPKDPCYTYTTSLHPKTCSPLDCIELMCIAMSTTELPCPTASCPKTPTATEWLPCPTACRGGCATATMQVVPDICTMN